MGERESQEAPAPDGGAGVSIVVVAWNASATLERCLASLLQNPPGRAYEVLVVDNASEDGSAAIAGGFGERVRVLPQAENRGFAGAANEGARKSDHDYLLFLNTDVEASPRAVEELCRVMDSRPDLAAAGGKLLSPDGSPQVGFNVRALPTLTSAAFEILMIDELFPRNPVTRRHKMLDFTFSELCEVDQPAGACLLIRRSVFETLGGFDERFHPAWFEDVDLCLRMRRNGCRIAFVPGAVFRHEGGESLTRLGYSQFLSIWYRNMLRFFRKHRGPAPALLLRGLLLVGMVERILAAGLVGARSGLTRADALTAYFRVLRDCM